MRPKKCFICDVATSLYIKNLFEQKTKFSETPVCKLLERLYEKPLTRADADSVICQGCLIRMDEYDEAYSSALRIETELRELLETTEQKYDSSDVDEKPDLAYVNVAEIGDFEDSTEVESTTKIVMKCKSCDKEFTSLLALQTHKHIQPKKETISVKRAVYSDEIFERDFTEIVLDELPHDLKPTASLAKMKLNVTPKPGTNNKCETCGKSFAARSEYRLHLKSHQTIFPCEICGMPFKTVETLNTHTELHDHVQPLECPICKKMFSKKSYLVRHMPIHSGDPLYQCDKCGKQFIHHSSFRMHIMAHDGIRSKQCDVCQQFFRSNSHLTRHMRIHTGDKPFTCPTCGQKFAQRYNMMTHYKGHLGITRIQTKDHKCSICGVAFTRKLKLDEHMEKVHDKCINNKELNQIYIL